MANTVIVPSQFFADRLVDDYEVPAAKIVIIPPVASIPIPFTTGSGKQKKSNEYLRIGYVGRLDKGKGGYAYPCHLCIQVTHKMHDSGDRKRA